MLIENAGFLGGISATLPWLGFHDRDYRMVVKGLPLEFARRLQAAGVEVLYDDRGDRAGVKFADADLIGNPIRLSVSTRTLAQGQAEIRLRTETESRFVDLGKVVDDVRSTVADLLAALQP